MKEKGAHRAHAVMAVADPGHTKLATAMRRVDDEPYCLRARRANSGVTVGCRDTPSVRACRVAEMVS